MEGLRFGVLGMGSRGRAWLHTMSLLPEARVTAICDGIAGRRSDGAARAGLAPTRTYADLADMLACPDVDAVAVVVEPERQAAAIVQSLEAGKHVLSEVPLAFTLEDCWSVVLAVERSGLTFAMAEQCSYAPFVAAWRQLIDEGLLGKVTYAEAQYFHGVVQERLWMDGQTGRPLLGAEIQTNPNARKTRVWNLVHPIWYTPHSLGPLLAVLQDRVVQVTCMSTRKQSYYREDMPIPDVEVALMKTEGDTVLRLACGFMSPSAQPRHWYHMFGSKGEVETGRRWKEGAGLEGVGSLMWLAEHHMPGRVEMDWSFTDYQRGLAGAGASGHGGKDLYPIHDFMRAVTSGARPLVDVYRAAEIAGPSAIAAQSADQGSIPLAVPDFRPGPARAAGQAPS